MAEGKSEVKKLSPPGIYAFTHRDSSTGIIVLEHVACVRWDTESPPSLGVYFATGPHVRLDERQGKELVELMHNLDNYRRSILAL